MAIPSDLQADLDGLPSDMIATRLFELRLQLQEQHEQARRDRRWDLANVLLEQLHELNHEIAALHPSHWGTLVGTLLHRLSTELVTPTRESRDFEEMFSSPTV